jgi:hypothetical protein
MAANIKWPIFKVIVTDFSWALIKSVLNSFNNLTVLEYLDVTFKFLDEGADIFRFSLVFICCAHFMKLITNQIKAKIFPQNKCNELKQSIKKCFALMIDATSFDELKKIFVAFVFVIESPTLNDCVTNHFDFIAKRTFQNPAVEDAFMS